MAIRVRVLGTRRVPDPWGRAWVPFFTRGLCPYPTRCQAGTGRGSNLTHGYPVGTRQTITEQNISVSLFQQFSPTFGPAQNSSSGHLVTLSRSKPVTRRSPIPPIPTRAAAPVPIVPHASTPPSALPSPDAARRPARPGALPQAAPQSRPPPLSLLLRRRSASSARRMARRNRFRGLREEGHNAAASRSGCRGSSPNLAVAASQAW
jgi:hypothetical protein